MAAQNLTAERLRELLSYDPETGVFTRLVSQSPNAIAGSPTGYKSSRGYLRIQIDGKKFLAHRLAWMYVYGAFPLVHTDHINGVRHDNRISNLRECTQSQNLQNSTLPKHNTSGLLGVGFYKHVGKWAAYIQVNGKKNHLGLFSTPELAHAAYIEAKAKLHTFQPATRTTV